MKEVCRDYEIKHLFSPQVRSNWASFQDEKIVIDSTQRPVVIISAAFHEICHILNMREKKYPIYHNPWNWVGIFSSKFKSTAFRAEVYTDRRAAKMMEEYFPELEYDWGYNTTSSREFLYNELGFDDEQD
jgi:hypothetical protein